MNCGPPPAFASCSPRTVQCVRGDGVRVTGSPLHLHIGCRLQLLLGDWYLKHTHCASDVPECMCVCVIRARGWRRLYRVEVGGLSHHRCIKYKAKDGRPVNQALQLHPDGHLSPSLQLTWISTRHTLTMCGFTAAPHDAPSFPLLLIRQALRFVVSEIIQEMIRMVPDCLYLSYWEQSNSKLSFLDIILLSNGISLHEHAHWCCCLFWIHTSWWVNAQSSTTCVIIDSLQKEHL